MNEPIATKARLDDLIMALAVARKEEAAQKDVKDIAWENVTASNQYKVYAALNDQYREKARLVDFLESKVRGVALILYQSSQQKDFSYVKVKIYKALAYELKHAIHWCMVAYPKALKLDTGAFEKAAKELELDFVSITDDPRVSIANDLEMALPPGSYEDVIDVVINGAMQQLAAMDQAEQEQKANH